MHWELISFKKPFQIPLIIEKGEAPCWNMHQDLVFGVLVKCCFEALNFTIQIALASIYLQHDDTSRVKGVFLLDRWDLVSFDNKHFPVVFRKLDVDNNLI